jgi:PAS domain-containing protein
MREIIYKSIISQASFGYAYNKMITDRNRNHIDYKILDVNPAFEELVGIRAEKLIGKKGSEVFPEVEKISSERISLFGKVAQSGKSETIEYFAEPLKKWYRVQVISYEKDYFILL